jgi:hypothetical protein
MCRPCLYTAHVYRDDITFDLGRYYIYELNPLPVAPLVLKFGIHHGQARRKGVRGGEEEGWSGGVESLSS